jgi:hypothetical protein
MSNRANDDSEPFPGIEGERVHARLGSGSAKEAVIVKDRFGSKAVIRRDPRPWSAIGCHCLDHSQGRISYPARTPESEREDHARRACGRSRISYSGRNSNRPWVHRAHIITGTCGHRPSTGRLDHLGIRNRSLSLLRGQMNRRQGSSAARQGRALNRFTISKSRPRTFTGMNALLSIEPPGHRAA